MAAASKIYSLWDMQAEVFMTIEIGNILPQESDRAGSLAVAAYREYACSLSADNWEIMQANLSNIAEIGKVGQLIVARPDNLHRDLESAELIGAVIYCPPGSSDPKIFQSEWSSIKMLLVNPQYRGQGIGTRLCLECIDRAKQDSAEIIALHTSELMMAARAMYTKLGFELDIELAPRLSLRYWRYLMRL